MAQIVNIPIDHLYPHPDNLRKDLGDLAELADSIKASGVLQNLTVVPRLRDMTDEEYRTACAEYRANPTEESQRIINRHTVAEGYTIIIGHRRHAAAQLAGLAELPCVIVAMDAREQLQTMLVENMQRSDLTVYEQAQGFQMMLNMGNSVAEIAEKSGFSKATVRRRLKMAELDSDTLKNVLTYKNGVVEVQEYEAGQNGWISGGRFWSLGTVTHWMPLPEAPKEGT